MTSCPALLIAAPASGQGKTTVTAALARLHARQGRRVRVFKCGPDFLDPHWHELASGAPVHSLDLWINGAQDCARRLHDAAREADLLLIEGVMGLFDGDPSAADLAQRFGVPVLAVVDASAMAGTFGALAHGLRDYRPGLPWAGVLANRVGSARHADMLQAGLRDPQDWQGALARITLGEGPALLPERHLGLVAAHELPDALARLDAAADALATTPLGRLDAAALQRFAVDFAPQSPAEVPPLLAGRTVAVARDAAFSFIYPANVQALQALGARLVFFSPLAGEALPACDALWLPGGYPELHAPALGARTDLAGQLREHANAGKPIWAEGGGLLALGEALVTRDGQAWPMWGLLPVRAQMQPRLAGLGMQTWEGARAGSGLRGHAFHFARLQTALVPLAQTRPAPGSVREQGEAIHAAPGWPAVRGSFFHPWFASDPVATAALFTEAREPGARP